MQSYIYGTNFVFDSRSADDVTLTAGVGQQLIVDGSLESSAPKSFCSTYNANVSQSSYVQNTWTTLDLTGITSTTQDFTVSSTGVLTYTGAPANFIAETNMSTYTASGAAINIYFGFDKNNSGTVAGQNTSIVTVPSSNYRVGSSLGFFSLTTGDTLTFKTQNTSGTSAVTFFYIQFYISQI